MKLQTSTRRGFSLVELLVVLAIVGLVASISLPALRGLGKSNSLVSTQRQLLDDLGLARQLALKNRTTVYMVFVPGNIWEHEGRATVVPGAREGEIAKRAFLSAASGPYSGYALLARRRVGDQPGTEHWQYLTEWKALPEGYVFPKAMFDRHAAGAYSLAFPDPTNYVSLLPTTPLPVAVAFPNKKEFLKLEFRMPYLAFDGFGRVDAGSRPQFHSGVHKASAAPFGNDFVITFTSGSVFLPRDADGNLIAPGAAGTETELDVVETPAPKPVAGLPPEQNVNFAYVPNRIVISSLTGRARILKPRIP